jgi:alpha-D-xyloside xylohydrolase
MDDPAAVKLRPHSRQILDDCEGERGCMAERFMTWRVWIIACLLLTFTSRAAAAGPTAARAGGLEVVADGMVVATPDGFVKLQVRAPGIVRVMYSADRSFFSRPSLVVVPKIAGEQPFFRVSGDAAAPTLDTGIIRATVAADTGRVSFFDQPGRPLLAELSRSLEPAMVMDRRTSHVRQMWEPRDGESLYGLGQHQFDAINLKGLSVDLWQRNTSIVVPLLVSSQGYGIFWENLSYTRFGDLRAWQPLGGEIVHDADGKAGGLTGTYFSGTAFDQRVAARVDHEIDIDVSRNRDLLSETGERIAPRASASPTAAPTTQRNTSRRRADNAAIHPDLPPGDAAIRWEGTFTPTRSGDYQFHFYGNGGIKFLVGDRVVFDHWRQSWLPADDVAKVHLESGRPYPIRAEWTKDGGAEICKIDFKPPADEPEPTSLWSEVGDGVAYYFIYGPKIDQVIAGMRELTGRATMMPRWAFGLWQSRQRYETQQQSLDVIDGFRKRGIPFDNIVQDWQYWRRDQWGSHGFDAQRFPDPAGWINAIHARNAHLMISVWGKFYRGTANYDELLRNGSLYPLNVSLNTRDFIGFEFTNYDAFNPAARAMFWRQMKDALFDKGVDAWWMDATEPDMEATPTLQGLKYRMNPTAAGTGAAVLNGYALQNARGVYEGQRAAAPDQRVFNLTRSGYAGQQRYAAASWSGDITSTWTAMRKQIPAGLGFSISGVPYWTMDSGGFSVPPRFARRDASQQSIDEWRELNTRWFEFATFVPLLRVHGEFPHREMWEFGGEESDAYKAQLKFDRLRYRMLPYTYSLAGQVTHDGATIMRALAFDFADDALARDLTDQYLFGPSVMVSPVTTYQSRTRSVYLPANAKWYDFWTGKQLDGGQRIDADTPYDAIPLHVRAGAILPFGPEEKFVGERPADPITLYVYTGADGDFTLYEDDGLTYGYERGAFSRIPLHFDDRQRTLTIGARHGEFPQMLKRRTFQIVFVTPDRPVGFSFDPKPDQAVEYNGAAVMVNVGGPGAMMREVLPDVGGADAVWRDASKTPDQRARDLLPRLTLEEKISLLHADTTFTSPGLPRFQISRLWTSDGPQGVREEIQPVGWNTAGRSDDFATAMPASIALAATFDPELAAAYGHVIGEEARSRGKHVMLCPGLNIMRTPLNGRNSEYFGEDPYLTGRMAVGFIRALQSHGVAACAKHFALNNQETARASVNVHIDERTLREIYLPAFKAAVIEGKVWTVMSAYNRVNGQYCSENEFLLSRVLKGDWGFGGMVMTDWGGCHSTLPAARNGLDLEMGTNVNGTHERDFLAAPLLEAARAGEAPMEMIDEMALRNLRVMAATGLLDGEQPPPENTLMSPPHIEAARRVAEAGIVLLKNDRQALPLGDAKVKTIAVIGENARTKFAHDGNSAAIKTAYEVTPLDGIARRAGDGVRVTFAQGYPAPPRRGGRRGLGGAVETTTAPAPTTSAADLLSEAVDAAKKADVAIVVAGLHRAQDQEGRDRPDMNLPAGQAELIAAVTKANPRTIVILNGGSPSVVEPWINDAAGLLMYWYGGTEGGNALARILFGDVNPSGRLPCTYPKQLADSPAHASDDVSRFPGAGTSRTRGQDPPASELTPETGPQEKYAEGIFVGYRWFDAKDIEPQFPFGFGLSYTDFDIADLRVTKPDGAGRVTVTTTVRNVGRRDGATIVQLYVRQNNPNPSFPRPPRELRAFRKISLGAGAAGELTLPLDASAFAYFDPNRHAWVAEAGDYTIYAGQSSRDLKRQSVVKLPQTIVIPEGDKQ